MNSAEWLDVFAEYGFDGKDAAGVQGASKTQLEGALSASEHSGSIDAAVKAGHLREHTTIDKFGNEVTRSYTLALAGGEQ